MDERSNPDLESALARGDLSPRKVAFAKEVLRRRYADKDGGTLWKHVWLPMLAMFSLARMALGRFRSPKE